MCVMRDFLRNEIETGAVKNMLKQPHSQIHDHHVYLLVVNETVR